MQRCAVLWIDTEGTFRPERVKEVAEKRFEIAGDQVLDNILVARCAEWRPEAGARQCLFSALISAS